MVATATPRDWVAGDDEGYEPSALFTERVPDHTARWAPRVAQLKALRDADPAWFDEALKSIYAEEVT